MLTSVLVVGAGGHGRVVVDALEDLQLYGRLVIADADASKAGQLFQAAYKIELLDNWNSLPADVHVAIGDNAARGHVIARALQEGRRLVAVVHSRAVLSRHSAVGDGSFVAANAVIGPAVRIGVGVIVNHGAIVDHDCMVGSYSHIGPNASLGGGCVIEDGVLVGAGATVLPGCRIGKSSIVAAGAVVVSDVGDGVTVMGVPAR